ncbi:MAG: ABC transporter permease [Tannerella sp.]|jgi:ABC-type antimicrobial peptide transport system permease subunit|nr:ABC transporter permease [Tannerella sp.]
MFYHLKIIIRGLRRGGIYSAINIGGLAIGMAAALLIISWIYHEWSYDRFHKKEKNLYLAYFSDTVDGSTWCIDWTPIPLAPAMKSDYPDVAAAARVRNETLLCANGDARLKIRTVCTDPDFLTMFDFPLVQGNRETALNDPYSIILTEKTAVRLFGNDDPMGKTLLVNGQHPMTVTGVMKDLPGNTRLQFEALAPIPFLKALGRNLENWGGSNIQTYIELNPNARPESVNESIRGILTAHDSSSKSEIFLYPLNRRHLYANFENGVPVGGLIDTLRLFGLIAGLILLIACINFMNLSTARSEKRAKEVGVRQVMGGNRLSLIRLFMGESMMVSLIAGVLAMLIAILALPAFSTLMGQRIDLNLANGWFWIAVSGFILFTGLLAGSYPAFYLSSFLPVKVLKGIFRKKQGAISSRKVLVVLQFTVACVLIVSTLVIHRQINYAQDRESGYNKDRLVYLRMEGDIAKNYELIKQDLLNAGVALSATRTNGPMTELESVTWGVDWQGKDPEAKFNFILFYTDADWTKTVGTTILAGRDIDIYTFPTDSNAMLLNESALKLMNLDDPIGQTVNTQGRDWHVVGVVRDFILTSPYDPVTPMVIGGPAGYFDIMHIKLNGANPMADNLAKAEQIFKQYNPAYPFDYKFIDEEYALKFAEEQKMGSLATGFAGLTVFISCLGLFALVAYMAETRRKEIGIRKVLGASVSGVILLLSKEFLILVLISVVIASPVAWWAMSQWLDGFAYRTNIPWWLFVVVGFISVGIALLTVGFQAVKAATANPVKAIKSE